MELDKLQYAASVAGPDGDRGEINLRDAKTQDRACYDAATNRSLFGLVFLVFIDLLEVYRLQTPHATSRKDRNAVSSRRALRAL